MSAAFPISEGNWALMISLFTNDLHDKVSLHETNTESNN